MSKIAFLFLTIGDINHPIFWDNYFKENFNKINIYCHPKNPDDVKTPWLKKGIIKNLTDTKWGFITKAYYNLMAEALQDKDNVKFITISESCIPLLPFDKFYNFVIKDPKKSFIKFTKLKKYDLEERIKTQKGYEKYKFRKHLARFCLSRHHVKVLLNNSADYQFFNKMHVGDEFFLSLLHPFNNVDDFAVTYDNWGYISKKIDDINRKIEKQYLIKEKENQDILVVKHMEDTIKSLQKIKDDISKNPKSYINLTQKDIEDAKSTKSFFWRKFPKDSQVNKFAQSFVYMKNVNLKVGHKKDINFIHIPKTAGMTITELFHKYLDMEVGYGWHRFKNKKVQAKDILKKELINEKTLDINTWHMPISYYNEKQLKYFLNNFDLFAIVRNPYSKIVSIYSFWLKYYHEKKDHDYFTSDKEYIEGIYDNNMNVSESGLNSFIGKLLSNDKYAHELDGHLIPSYKYTHIQKSNKLEKICTILKYENLNEDFNKFIKNNNLSIPQNSIDEIFINTSKSKLTQDNLNSKSIKLINSYYELDFKLFDYKMKS